MASTNNVRISTTGTVTYVDSATTAASTSGSSTSGIVSVGAGNTLLTTTSSGSYAIKSLVAGSGIILSHDANTVTISYGSSSSSSSGSSSGLSNVSVTNPVSGDYLTYNGTNWVAGAAPTVSVSGTGIAKYSANTIRYYKITISYSGVATTTTATTATTTTTTTSGSSSLSSYTASLLPTGWSIDLTKMGSGYLVVTSSISAGTSTPMSCYVSVPDQSNVDRTVAQDYRTIYTLGAPSNGSVTAAASGLNLLTKVSDPTYVAIQGLTSTNVPLTAGDSFDIYIGYMMLVDTYA